MRSPSRRAALAALLACAAASAALPSGAQNRAPYLVGAILSLTGSGERAGLSAAESLDVVVRHINATGGVGGRSLEIRVLDDGGRVEQAQSQLKRLAADSEVLAVLGGTQRSTAAVLEKAANDAEVPFLSLGPRSSPADATLPWVFRLAVPESKRIGMLVDYAKRHALSRVSVLFSNDEYGQGAAKLGGELAAAAGLTIVGTEQLPLDGRGDDGFVLRAKSNGTQSILAFVSERGPIALAKAMSSRAPGLATMADVPAATPEFLRAAGKEADYWHVASPKVAVAQLVAPSDPLHGAIVDFVKLYPPNVAPDAMAGSARDGLMLIARALATARADRGKIRASLEGDKEFVGAMGVYRMTPADHGAVDGQGLTLIEGSRGAWRPAT